ncbi:hypothetical protein [Neisseria sp. Ec49-e6-T10]|uniref:hypothetical protein n=1 Tax=Neisseria sp. Ec49-e6-T10 TaxID=3140744 RepID=UPI003EBC7B8F
MLTIKLPKDIEQRLNTLAQETKRFYVLESLSNGYSLDDLENIHIVQSRLEAIPTGQFKTIDLRDYGIGENR